MTRSIRRPLAVLCLAAGALLVPSLASAKNLQQVQAQPSPAQTGQPIQVTVQTGGAPCAYTIDYGPGPAVGPFGNGNGTKTHTTQYAQPGTHTITVKGKKLGGKPACGNGPITTTVTVQGNRGGTGGGNPVGFGKVSKETLEKIAPQQPGSPPPNLKFGCDDLPCVTGVKVSPHGSYADFEIFTSNAASVQVYASTKPLSPNTLGKPPHAAMSLGHKYVSTPRMMNLQPGTLYYFVVKSVDPKGIAMWEKGSFKTLRRQVELSIAKIDVHDDADAGTKGKGDFTVKMKALGTETEFKFKADSGATYQPLHPLLHKIVWNDAPAELAMILDINERDDHGSGVAFQGADNVDELSLWAGESGLAEETDTTFTHRAQADYDMTLHFRQVVRYLP